jgi:fused signal recognition particle receptor
LPWTGFGKRLREVFRAREFDEGFFQELEDAMIEADMGVRTAAESVDALREAVKKEGLRTRAALTDTLRRSLRDYIVAGEVPVDPKGLTVLLVLGVNGVGKTTTIAKLAQHFRARRGIERILLVAGDTFRAAAIEQLKLWGERLDMPVVAQEQGADPGAVIYDGITSAVARGTQLVIADTAGRLHNRESLVKELAKIDKIVKARVDGPAPSLERRGSYRKILVLDATTGQNSLAQAEVFHQAVGIDAIVLSKCDSTAKGGMVVPVCRELRVPFAYVGLGEKLDDLEVFDPDQYLATLFGPP